MQNAKCKMQNNTGAKRRVSKFLHFAFNILHLNQGGAIGILMLFCMWAVVLIIAVIFNTIQLAAARQETQTAADTIAQASANWIARTANQATATNMLICENASAGVIASAVPPTSHQLHAFLNQELIDVQKTGAGSQTPLRKFSADSATAYALANLTLSQVQGAMGNDRLTAQEKTDLQKQVTTAQTTIDWINNTWVNGAASGLADPPRDAMGGGSGLINMIDYWLNVSVPGALNLTAQTIPQEIAIVDRFDARTAAGVGAGVVADLQTKRKALFTGYQQEILNQLPSVIENQRAQMATFYKRNVTLADPGLGNQNNPGSAQLRAPVMTASDPDMPTDYSHTDSIRARYPDQAAKEPGLASNPISIDPVNVHTDEARIWHPGVDVPLPADLVARYPGLPSTVHVDGWEGGWHLGWGHVFCVPLEIYFDTRVVQDASGLDREYMQQIDALRKKLHDQLRAMGLPDTSPNVPGTTKSGQPLLIPPSVSTTNADAALQRAITNFNAAAYAYGNLISGDLGGRVNAYTGGLYRFTWAFAAHVWHANVDRYRFSVLKDLGENKQFLVLRTYKLQKLPDWTVQSMQSSAGQYIYQTVYSRNMGAVQSLVQGTIIASEYQQLLNQYQGGGGGPVDPTVQRYLQRQAELAAAPEVAAAVAVAVQQGASQISTEVAAEWVARPWPYEITPPDQAPPKRQGLSMADRVSYFSWLAGAQSQQPPPRVLSAAFGKPRDPLVAYAQAEIFNWNEFSPRWGGLDQLDQVTRHVNQLSSNFNGVMSGSPAFWRLSNTGGWNWQPRLGNADALSPALTKNPEFYGYFKSAGLTPDNDARSLRDINLH